MCLNIKSSFKNIYNKIFLSSLLYIICQKVTG